MNQDSLQGTKTEKHEGTVSAESISSHEYGEYNADDIKVRKGLQGVRQCPGMYIEDTDINGLHRLVYEVVDNAVDEHLAGFCSKIIITLHEDGSIAVLDNGRGVPTDIIASEGVSALEVILTQLHSGAKFEKSAYEVSGGLHGVGMCVITALSKKLTVKSYRSSLIKSIAFENGEISQALHTEGTTDFRGTEVCFLPDDSILVQ